MLAFRNSESLHPAANSNVSRYSETHYTQQSPHATECVSGQRRLPACFTECLEYLRFLGISRKIWLYSLHMAVRLSNKLVYY